MAIANAFRGLGGVTLLLGKLALCFVLAAGDHFRARLAH